MCKVFRGFETILEVIWLKKCKNFDFFENSDPGSVFLGATRQKCIKSKNFFCKWFLSLFGTEKTPGEQDLKILTKKVYLPPTPIQSMSKSLLNHWVKPIKLNLFRVNLLGLWPKPINCPTQGRNLQNCSYDKHKATFKN